MTKPAFKFHHLFSSTYKISLPSGEFLGNVEFENGLVEKFMFFHASVKKPHPGLPLRGEGPCSARQRATAGWHDDGGRLQQEMRLRKLLAAEDVAKALSGSKEMRDRIYTLVKEKQQELRMFASFAFRDDKTNKRRGLFASSYLRKRNRRARAKAQTAPPTAE